MLIRLALLSVLQIALSSSNVLAEDKPCGPVKAGGQWHYPGEVWRDDQGVHVVPQCPPSIVTPTAPLTSTPTQSTQTPSADRTALANVTNQYCIHLMQEEPSVRSLNLNLALTNTLCACTATVSSKLFTDEQVRELTERPHSVDYDTLRHTILTSLISCANETKSHF
jgi:hypothetical protein